MYLDESSSIWGSENSHVIQQLEWFLKESDETGALFPPILFIGQKGVGKTRLMNLVGNKISEIKQSVYICRGSDSFKNERDVQKAIIQVVKSDGTGEGVLGIDEIHNIRPRASDELGTFLSLTETGKYRFTVLGATTEPGKVKKPLESRMIKLMIANYSEATLALIAKAYFPELTEDAASMLSKITDGSPRYILQQLIRPLKAFAHSKRLDTVDVGEIKEWMQVRKLDRYGLTPEQRMYIMAFNDTLFMDRDKKMSIDTIAAKIEQSSGLTKEDIERRLVQLGFVEIDKGGRKLTDAGYDFLREIKEMEIL